MTDAATASEAVFVALDSMLRASGRFATVNRHEVKNAPLSQLTAELWGGRIEPVPPRSGLDVTSIMITYRIRIGMGMLTEPQDAIDPAVMGAVIDLMTKINANLTFGQDGVEVDLLKSASEGLFSQDGYIPRDNKLFRVQDVSVPVMFHDVFPQAR